MKDRTSTTGEPVKADTYRYELIDRLGTVLASRDCETLTEFCEAEGLDVEHEYKFFGVLSDNRGRFWGVRWTLNP